MSRSGGYKYYNIRCGSCIGKTLCGEPGDGALECDDRMRKKSATDYKALLSEREGVGDAGGDGMRFGFDYTHSAVDGNGVEYITFMLEPERLDGNGLRYGKAVHIDIDNKRQKTTVYTFDWIRGGPANHEKIAELKDDVVGDVEISGLMERLGIEVKEAHQ